MVYAVHGPEGLAAGDLPAACGFSEKDLCRRSIIFSPTPLSRGSIWWGVRWARAASASLTSAGICLHIPVAIKEYFPPASSFAIRDSTRSACSRGRMRPSGRGAAASSARRRRSRNRQQRRRCVCQPLPENWNGVYHHGVHLRHQSGRVRGAARRQADLHRNAEPLARRF